MHYPAFVLFVALSALAGFLVAQATSNPKHPILSLVYMVLAILIMDIGAAVGFLSTTRPDLIMTDVVWPIMFIAIGSGLITMFIRWWRVKI